MGKHTRLLLLTFLLVPAASALAGTGKLPQTAGVTQIEGSAGGGLVPWAILSGYDTRNQTSLSAFSTRVSVDNYRLYAYGGAFGYHDRVEISAAHQTFDLLNTAAEINQNIFGAKVRLYGDVIYSRWPQLSAGLQYKELLNTEIAQAVGAKNSDHGTDVYLSATKVHLGAFFGYNLVWDLTLRGTKANQFGLLGYGGDKHDNYQLMAEGSVAVLLNRKLALGAEYRQKPNNLSAFKEQDAKDIFLAYIPNKAFSITAAWVDLGSIAGADRQTGPYISFTGYLW